MARLAESGSPVGELAAPFDISLPAISRHLRVRRCALDAAPLRAASDWIERYRRFWEDQFDSLADYFERTQDRADGQMQDQPKEKK